MDRPGRRVAAQASTYAGGAKEVPPRHRRTRHAFVQRRQRAIGSRWRLRPRSNRARSARPGVCRAWSWRATRYDRGRLPPCQGTDRMVPSGHTWNQQRSARSAASACDGRTARQSATCLAPPRPEPRDSASGSARIATTSRKSRTTTGRHDGRHAGSGRETPGAGAAALERGERQRRRADRRLASGPRWRAGLPCGACRRDPRT